MAWVRARLCKLQKRVHSTHSHQLLAHGQLFSPGIPASSTTKTGRHDIAESGAKHQKSNQIKLFVFSTDINYHIFGNTSHY